MDEQQKMLERYKERLNKCVTMSKKLLIEKVGGHMHMSAICVLEKSSRFYFVRVSIWCQNQIHCFLTIIYTVC